MIKSLLKACFAVALVAGSNAFAQTSVYEHAQKQAMQLYPDLAVTGSAFHTAFMSKVAELRRTNPNYFGTGDWPLTLAKSLVPEPIVVDYTITQALENGAVVTAPRLGKIYIDGLDGQNGERGRVRAWPAGNFGGQTVGAGYLKLKGYTTSCSNALK